MIKKPISYIEITPIIFFSFIAFFLRVRNLGGLGFAADEELTALAVKGLIENGYPVMPSGMPYLRGLPFSYLLELSVYVFGFNEFSLRLPSVLFATLKIPLVYFLTKLVLDKGTAILVTIIISFSVFDIQISRLARMYSMFGFFYLLSLYIFYRGFIKGEKICRWVTPLLFIFTFLIHDLGVTLLFLFLLPLLLKNYNFITKKFLIGLFFIVGFASLSILSLKKWFYFYLMPENDSLSMEVQKSLLDKIWGLPMKIFYMPDLNLFRHLMMSKPSFLAIVISIIMIFLYLILRKYQKGEKDLYVYYTVILIAAFFHLYTIAIIIFLSYLYKTQKGLYGISQRPAIIWLSILALTFILWFLYGLFIWKGGDYSITNTSNLIRRIIKSLIAYPAPHIRIFFEAFPKMSIIVILALSMVFHKIATEKSKINLLFLFYSFISPLLISGIVHEWTQTRYIYHLYPIFIMLYSWVIISLVSKIIGMMLKGLERYPIPYGSFSLYIKKYKNLAFIFVLIFILHYTLNLHSIRESYAVSNYTYGRNTYPVLDGYESYPDHKGAGSFVRRHLQEGDIVIAMDAYQQAYYTGKVDYKIKLSKNDTSEKQGINIYTKSKVISDLPELLQLISMHKDGRVWLITSNEIASKFRYQVIDKDIDQFLEKNSSKCVYTGRDRKTKVYILN